jgi:hypothetical protein
LKEQALHLPVVVVAKIFVFKNVAESLMKLGL